MTKLDEEKRELEGRLWAEARKQRKNQKLTFHVEPSVKELIQLRTLGTKLNTSEWIYMTLVEGLRRKW